MDEPEKPKMDEQLQRDWSNLPGESLSIILKHLNDTNTDRSRLRGVCTTWRTSLPSKPRLNFPLKIQSPDGSRSCYIKQSVLYLITHKKGVWLTRVAEKSSGTWAIENPTFTKSLFAIPIKGKVSFLKHNIFEVTGCYHSGVKVVIFPKVTLDDDSVSLLILYGNGDLKLLKFGSDEGWVTIPARTDWRFSDIILYDDEFYVTDLKGRLMVINPVTFEVRDVITSNVDGCDGKYSYLVESCGKLYLVNKIVAEESGFMDMSYLVEGKRVKGRVHFEKMQPLCLAVWSLSVSKSCNGKVCMSWKPTKSLDDRVFFVNPYVTFSIAAHELGWRTGDCIFFNDEEAYIDSCDHCQTCYEREGFCDDCMGDLYKVGKNCGVLRLKQGEIETFGDDDHMPSEFNVFYSVPDWLDRYGY